MEFKVTTFFEKYKIEPNVDKEKIMIIFQTDPNKRKDLPIVLKTISNNEKLFEEELFTKHIDNSSLNSHTKIEELIETSKKQNIASNAKDISKLIIEISNQEDYYKNFFYANKINNDKAIKMFDDYLICLIDKLKHEFLGSIGEVSDELLKVMYNSIINIYEKVERFNKLKDDFNEDLCDYLNNVLTLDNVGKEFSKRFCSLVFLNKLIKNEYYTNSIKYTVNKMNKDVEKYNEVLIDSYEYICKVFKGKELKEVSSFITTLIFRDLHLRAEKNSTECKKSLKRLAKIQKCCLLYNKHKTIEDNDFITAEQLCDFMVLAGEEWQARYNEAFKSMIEDSTEDAIYNVVEIITEQNPTDEVLRIFSNVITDITGFGRLFEYIIQTHEASMNKTSDKYINPKDVDSFIAKFYWLVYTNYDSNITKVFFDNIRNIGFDILAINEESMKLLNNPYTDYTTRNIIRSRVLESYEVLPGDWKMDDGKTIRQIFSQLGETFKGTDGVSSTMIKKYDSLFRAMKKRIKDLYHCPECDYIIEYEDENCRKCGCGLDWSDISEIDNTDDYEEEYEEEETTSSESSGWGWLWFLIGFTIFLLLVVRSLL